MEKLISKNLNEEMTYFYKVDGKGTLIYLAKKSGKGIVEITVLNVCNSIICSYNSTRQCNIVFVNNIEKVLNSDRYVKN